MKLYVPEIGDIITLKEDWTFDLYAESRNEQLGEHFGHYNAYYKGCNFIDSSVLPKLRDADYNIEHPTEEECQITVGYFGMKQYSHDKFRELYNLRANANPEYIQYQLDSKAHLEEVQKIGKKSIKVTLPKGTILKIDRIYIRKGSSDYSSITFYAKDMLKPNTKKKYSPRFWAKLSDCNQIEF